MSPVIDIRHLSAVSHAGPVLRDVSLSVDQGEAMALVGESGAGKSTIAKALLGILPAAIRVTAGEILFEGVDLLTLAAKPMRDLLGVRIALIPQDPQTALNPSRRIGDQMTDGLRLRAGLSRSDAMARALGLLNDVHIREPEKVLKRYPHELSGGMRQRVLIAQAFSLNPHVVIADEPTTALDVTVQKQVLRLIRQLQREHRTTLLFVTHDLGVVAQICDRMTVLYGGKVLEQGPTADVLKNPAHAYTRALLAANPRYDRPEQSLKPVPEDLIAELRREIFVLMLITARDLCLDVPDMGHQPGFGKRRRLRILKSVSLQIERGETLGIVGESGSGKTSLGRTLLRLYEPSEGQLLFDGTNITHLPQHQMKPLRRRMQMIFQDPQSSLNPRHSIGAILGGAMRLHGLEAGTATLTAILARVGLPASALARYPHQLSGGQRQRVGIARAIALKPEFVVADEIVSGLDVSTQAQVLDLLKGLKQEFGLALAFISHDLSVIRHICDRVVIMRAGEIIESGNTADIFNAPKSEFTRALINAIPLPEPDTNWLEG